MGRRTHLDSLDARLGRAVAGWIALATRAPARTTLLCVASAVLVVGAGLPRLGLHSNEDALFSKGVAYAKLRDEFRRAFPALIDPVLVVIDAQSVDQARESADALRARLRAQPELFPVVFEPGGGPFFDHQGLLYLEPNEVADLVDRLVEVQPYLGTLARDGSLRGLFSLLSQVSDVAASGEIQRFELASVFDQLSDSIESVGAGIPRDLSWAELLLGRPATAQDLRRLILVQPRIDYTALEPARETLLGLRASIAELGLDDRPGVDVRLTGLFPLSTDEAEHVSTQAGVAGVASFLLVSLVTLGGLRSGRLVLALLATLLTGLGWTVGFAAFSLGHLNLISVAFAVLFIGLSVDFGIHIVVRFRELLDEGQDRVSALSESGRSVGGSLVICSTTTAIAFFGFLPTDFVGMAELGWIAGWGMFFSLFANITLLPALLALGRPYAIGPLPPRFESLLALPVRYPGTIAIATVILAVGSVALLPQVRFDLNPLRVRDPSTESVQAFNDLLADGMAFPWNVNVLAADADSADAMARRLEALPTVSGTLTLGTWIPDQQPEKLELIGEASFLLLPTLEPKERAPDPTLAEQVAAIRELSVRLAALEVAPVDAALSRSAGRLQRALASFAPELTDPRRAENRVDRLERSLLGSLPGQLRVLRASLRAEPMTAADLPPDLLRETIAADGRVRIEVFPREDLNDNDALERYVTSVTELAPDAFGEGIVIHQTGRIVVRSFQQALAFAAVAITLLLLALWRSPTDAALAMLPIGLAALLTAASSAIFDIPFNFANVIVIPLLLGMGVDSGIHLVHRVRYAPLPGGNLLRTSTARAVVLSALTTLASFGTLGFTSHMGMASLGRLLSVGIALILLCNLLVLPVVVAMMSRSKRVPAVAGDGSAPRRR
jgi:hopanoid biosynthesis associated RND transporter like protein HpnN